MPNIGQLPAQPADEQRVICDCTQLGCPGRIVVKTTYELSTPGAMGAFMDDEGVERAWVPVEGDAHCDECCLVYNKGALLARTQGKAA